MSNQVFSPVHNMLARVSILLVVGAVAGGLGLMDLYHKSPYVRYTHMAMEQPVPFSHKHHVNLGIDCRYCHTSVEDSHFAGIPPTKTCMNCHNVMWKEAPMLEPVRESFRTGESIEWNRVHDLPDFVYFNHSIHVNKGIGCETCHGRVDQMPLIKKEHALFMKWCLECHRDPTKFIRPRELITKMGYDPKTDLDADMLAEYGLDAPVSQAELGKKLVEAYHVEYEDLRLTNCSVCHR